MGLEGSPILVRFPSMTTFTFQGQDRYLLCVQDRGTLTFYITHTSDFPHGWSRLVGGTSVPRGEEEHSALLLYTDTANAVWAIGLNRTAAGVDKVCLYTVDPPAGALGFVKEYKVKTTAGLNFNGPRLRWGAGLEQVGDMLLLH